jgi:hypothetical protein
MKNIVTTVILVWEKATNHRDTFYAKVGEKTRYIIRRRSKRARDFILIKDGVTIKKTGDLGTLKAIAAMDATTTIKKEHAYPVGSH